MTPGRMVRGPTLPGRNLPICYDNIDPRQNIWCIVTTSDPGHDALEPTHKVKFRCERINTWRDNLANNGRADV